MKTPTPIEIARRCRSAMALRGKEAADHHALADLAYRGQRPEPQRDDAPGPAPLTAGFDRAHADLLAPGCYRVRAAPLAA